MSKARNIADLGSNDVLDTTASGVSVTGSVTSDALTVEGNSAQNAILKDDDSFSGADNQIKLAIAPSVSDGNSAGIAFGTYSDNDYWKQGIFWQRSGSYGVGDLIFANRESGDTTTVSDADQRMRISKNGDITMYKDDGSTAGMTFDASAGSMAVGTSNLPSDVSVVAADGIKVDVGTSDTTRIYAKSTGTGAYSLGTSGGSAIAFHRLADNSDEIGFETHHAGNNHTERMRLNYHGQLTLEGTGTPFDTTPSKNGLQLYYESDSGVATIASYSNGGGTQLDFQTNTGAGATDRIMTINTAGVVVNPDAEDKDFRVASDNNSNMLLVDGSTNRVGVGTNSPTHDLTIGMSDLGDASLSFRSSTYSSLGTIKVSHDSGTAESSMRFHTRTGGNEPERMRIAPSGAVSINTDGYTVINSPQHLTLGTGNNANSAGLHIIRGETLGGGTGPYITLKHGPDSGTQTTGQIYSYNGDLHYAADTTGVDSDSRHVFEVDGNQRFMVNRSGDFYRRGANELLIGGTANPDVAFYYDFERNSYGHPFHIEMGISHWNGSYRSFKDMYVWGYSGNMSSNTVLTDNGGNGSWTVSFPTSTTVRVQMNGDASYSYGSGWYIHIKGCNRLTDFGDY